MIYYHVFLLRKNSFDAYVLHDKKPYKLTWISLNIPFLYVNTGLEIKKDDFLIIPEFFADLPQLSKFKCKKIVFVQNAFYIFDGLKNGKTYEDLGIIRVFYYMPHLKKILQSITDLPLYETPPFIAPYFYSALNISERKRRILLYPKFDNRDYIILKRMLEDKLGLKGKKTFQKFFLKNSDWEIIELKNKKHHEVAEEMKQAAFFISLNTTEAFNSSVPEAMAAGCINICYEGVGPADFLEDNINAFVFSNNHIFSMADKIIELVTDYDARETELQLIRIHAKQTAEKYKIDYLEKSLIDFFSLPN
jgi:glycosyltransferase involved in cell wall biosynthesis